MNANLIVSLVGLIAAVLGFAAGWRSGQRQLARVTLQLLVASKHSQLAEALRQLAED
jgi:hypothetical protein